MRWGATSISAPAKREFSAGGVVVRDGDVAVVVPVKRSSDGQRRLSLPKGHLDGGETAEQAATREVREEAGVVAELIDGLGEIRYQFEKKGAMVDKTVAFFLFAYRSGDVADHDHEVEDARWVPLEQAARTLTHPLEREVVTRALSRLRSDR